MTTCHNNGNALTVILNSNFHIKSLIIFSLTLLIEPGFRELNTRNEALTVQIELVYIYICIRVCNSCVFTRARRMSNEFTIPVITYKMGWFSAPFHIHNHVGNIPYIKPYSIHIPYI